LLFFVQDEASESATVNLESKLDAVADKEQGGSDDKEHVVSADTLVASDSKKDPFQRRHELLMKSDLAEVLVTCI
jgi:pumilio family protein 6